MSDLHFTLVTDGRFDRVLLFPLIWLLRQHASSDISIQREWADLGTFHPKPTGLAEKIATALYLYPCDLLFVHRDAEKEDPAQRYEEIRVAILGADVPVVGIVPVRMTEAWLLFDEQAVRRAAGNPNGRERLPVPVADPENVADPKELLHDALRLASGLSGRRLSKFNARRVAHRVAEYIGDFSPLRSSPSFARLENDLREVLQQNRWA
jgi:hypothetical protein